MQRPSPPVRSAWLVYWPTILFLTLLFIGVEAWFFNRPSFNEDLYAFEPSFKLLVIAAVHFPLWLFFLLTVLSVETLVLHGLNRRAKRLG